MPAPASGDAPRVEGAEGTIGADDNSDEVRWIRSYVLAEGDGMVGTVCIYEAASEDELRKHADLAELPIDEVVRVADTVIVRPDPQPAAAS